MSDPCYREMMELLDMKKRYEHWATVMRYNVSSDTMRLRQIYTDHLEYCKAENSYRNCITLHTSK